VSKLEYYLWGADFAIGGIGYFLGGPYAGLVCFLIGGVLILTGLNKKEESEAKGSPVVLVDDGNRPYVRTSRIKRWHKWGLATCILGLFILIAYRVVRKSKENNAAHSHIHFADPCPPSDVPPLLPFRVSEIPQLNIHWDNLGPSQVQGGHQMSVLIRVVNTGDARDAFTRYRDEPRPSSFGGLVNSGEGIYRTFSAAPLLQADVEGLLAGQKYLCALGTLDWSDDSGDYETRLARCGGIESSKTFNWHSQPDDNAERQLRSSH
jgi:hypothetical protein